MLECTEMFSLFIDELKIGFVEYLKLLREYPAISVLLFHINVWHS